MAGTLVGLVMGGVLGCQLGCIVGTVCTHPIDGLALASELDGAAIQCTAVGGLTGMCFGVLTDDYASLNHALKEQRQTDKS